MFREGLNKIKTARMTVWVLMTARYPLAGRLTQALLDAQLGPRMPSLTNKLKVESKIELEQRIY